MYDKFGHYKWKWTKSSSETYDVINPAEEIIGKHLKQIRAI